MPKPALSSSAAKRLLEAEAEVDRKEAELEHAKRHRLAVRKEIRSRIPLSSDGSEKKRKIRSTLVGGVNIRVTPAKAGDRFSLRRYREAGHEITTEMKDAIEPGRRYDRWTVKPAVPSEVS